MSQREVKQSVKARPYERVVVYETKTCPVCGNQFEGIKQRRFDTRACQMKADYAKYAETYRKKRMNRYWAEKKKKRALD